MGTLLVFAFLSYFLDLFSQPKPTALFSVMAYFAARQHLFPLTKVKSQFSLFKNDHYI